MNWFRLLIAFFFYYWQNKYFGWNALPMSDAELFADGLFLLMVLLSYPAQTEGGTK